MPEIRIEMDKRDDEGTLAHEVQVPPDHSAVAAVDVDASSTVVPIFLFLAVALTFCAKYYFAHRARQEVQNTVRMALERGTPLTPELLDRLGQPARPVQNDLRRGVVGICLGFGIAGFGFILGEPDATRPLMAIGVVPVLLGLAYLVLWRLSGKKA